MPRTVTTIDDTLRIFAACDLGSNVLARISKGAEIELGETTAFEGREWIRVVLKDGTSGWVLAPSVRGHTTLAAERAILVERAAVAAGIERSQQPTELVFRPTGSVQWPKRCAACFSHNPTGGVTLGVEHASTTAKTVGWITGGAIMHKAVEAFAVGLHGEVQQYTVPICASCKRSVSRQDVSELASSSEEAFTAILHRRIQKGCVVLTFNNAAYDTAFRSANAGHVYNSVDDCLAAEKSPLEEGAAATAAAQVKEAKKVPCMGCTRMIPNSELVCPHCGHTQWGRIVSYLFVGLVLLGVGYELCGPGVWRWLWWILGALLTLASIGEVVKSIRWRKESQ
jgi:hypothetical protein